jgi:endonuclease YncB( thermonuclease family)
MRFLALALCLMASPAMGQTFSGRVVSVFDGDTLIVLAENKRLTVHLAEIDAPELRQASGARARESLAELCLDKTAQVRVVARDRHGNTLGRVHCDGVDANAEQVHRGMAWVYRRDARYPSPLHFLEDQAQRTRAGLWAEPSPAEPWRWRANRANWR